MLKVLLPTIMLVPTALMAPARGLWPTALAHSLVVSIISILWLNHNPCVSWTSLNALLGLDGLSAPLLVLTCWLLPLMILASHKHISAEPIVHQRTYITLLTSLQIFLIMAFSATDLMVFYIMFEATLIPTLILIARWGAQAERLKAATYILFYTLVGSLPLLIGLLTLYNQAGTLSLTVLPYLPRIALFSVGSNLWCASCLVGFLVKMPLYGVHLWLPKAHVEAPVAGSMVLAAVLLKLGGYGLMRIVVLLEPLNKNLVYPLVILALWGILMTGATCLRQTDLKSLIAYSSVGHMGLVVGGIFTQTPWGFAGALTLMIAHGLTSSALFCLANTNYERTHSRTMVLARGMQILLPLMTAWWFMASLANLALPPLPNLMAELMIIVSLMSWSYWTVLFTGAGILITASYSLYMFIMTQRGPLPQHITGLLPSHTREHLLMALHLLPLLMLMSNPRFVWAWMA
uniref:NADH-ubiquinone oxidoreductase chain 4 n=1 Tax=Gobiidae sp. TaxID=3040165 RepID=A0AA95Z3N2_9GOBI|nr:NADH dehydrogenase subunit 4 [Gobiidae sp.]